MRKLILFFLGVLPLMLNAQTIDFTSRAHSNSEFSISIYNGIKIDTIARGQVSMVGAGKFVVPEKYKDVSAMASLSFGEKVKPIDIILHGQSFSFEILEQGRLSFSGSSENDLFYNKQSEVLKDENKDTYVYSYVKILNTMVKLSKVLGGQGQPTLFDKTNAKIGILNDVDVDKLYYSRFWFYAIDGLLRLSTGEEGFANDMIRLIDKTRTDKVFVALVEDFIMISNQYGMDDAFDIVIPHVKKLGRIEYPQGNIYDAFAMMKVMRGAKAPTIVGLEDSKQKVDYTLIVFHQPGCENCHIQLDLLQKRINFFKQNNVRIVSISGALDKAEFISESKNFSWNDKLCDLKGFAGQNFMNYGITGTPTFFLIDSDNVIIKRFAMEDDVDKYLIGTLQ